MKIQMTTCRRGAFNYFELVVVIGVLVVLAVLLLPVLRSAKQHAQRITCNGRLKLITMSNKIWANDHDDKYPIQMAMTNGATANLIGTGSMFIVWQMLSNEINAPQILHCPADKNTSETYGFENLKDANISYFLGVDASEENLPSILTGDDNLAIGGKPVLSGISNLNSNSIVEWTAGRHPDMENIGLADGSVSLLSNLELNNAIEATGLVTNRVAIP